MTEADYSQKLDDLDRLLNDPATPLDANQVWSLLFEVVRHYVEFERRDTDSVTSLC